MTPVSPPLTELLAVGQALQNPTAAAVRFFRSMKKDNQATLVLLLSICGLIWSLNYFSTKR
jgi:hypothetical protein